MRKALLLAFVVALLLVPQNSFGQWGRALARGAGRSAARSSRQVSFRAMRRDFSRDRFMPAKKLRASRSVFRYTSTIRARAESHQGIPAGSHLTSRARPGRPLSPTTAQRRFGLPRRPAVRERVQLRRGTLVRMNKALGGERGMGEIELAQRVPRQDIHGLVRLRKSVRK